jgi:hypothetical protein
VKEVGGGKKMDAAILPSLHFRIRGFPVLFSPAGVLLHAFAEVSKIPTPAHI